LALEADFQPFIFIFSFNQKKFPSCVRILKTHSSLGHKTTLISVSQSLATMTNKEIAKTWFASIDQQNFDRIKFLMDARHTFANPMTPTPIGPDEHIGMMQMMTSGFTGEHHLDLILEDHDHAVVRGRWKGKHTGEFNGLPATGKPVEFTFIDIFEIVNEKVRRETFEMNPMTIMVQIGAVPAS
jgi:predicted ester cyclase